MNMTLSPPHDRLTVVVAARNEALALPKLHPRIAAVLKRLDNVETRVLYVDDGSTDGSLPLLREIAAQDGRVRVFAQANGGVAAARSAAE